MDGVDGSELHVRLEAGIKEGNETTRLDEAINREGATLYDFDAAYTLADLGQGMRITAIAHNESPRLRTVR